jgi:hypothetical protein
MYGTYQGARQVFLPLKTNSYFLGDAWFVQIFVQIDAGYEGVL